MSTRRRLAVSLVAAAAAAGAVPLFVGTGPAAAAPAPAQCPSTPSYDYTIPTPVGPPAAVSLGEDDFADVGYTALGADKKLYYVESFIDSDPLSVSPLACLGGQATSTPALALGNDGTRAFFVRASNGKLYQRYVTTNYSSLGSFAEVNSAVATDGPAALQDEAGTYHLFVRGTNGALYHGYKTTSSPSSWRFESLGGQIVGTPSAIVDGTRILVAAVGTNGAVYTVRGDTDAWGGFTKVVSRISGTSSTQLVTKNTPALVKNPNNGAITVYAASSTFGLYAISKAPNAGFTNSLWYRLDSVLPPNAYVAAATNGSDSIVFARYTDSSTGKILTAYTQYLDSTGTWSDYFLAPYTCFNCAPYGVGTTSTARTGLAKAKLSPGQGEIRKMPATPKVLG